jgi:hypothetical protein
VVVKKSTHPDRITRWEITGAIIVAVVSVALIAYDTLRYLT